MASEFVRRAMHLLIWMGLGLLAACGGGGGGPSLSLSFSPASVSVIANEDESSSFDVAARVTGSVNGDVVVVIRDPIGVIQSRVDISQFSEESYSARFYTAENLSVGVHSGSIEVLLCSDQSCSKRYGGAKLPYTITVNPVPKLDSLSPSRLEVDSPAQTLTLNGANFEAGAQVYFDNTLRPSVYQSPTQLTVQLGAGDLSQERSYTVRVAVRGRSTRELPFVVSYDTPILESLSPNRSFVGGAAPTVTLNGSQFHPDVQVYWDGNLHAAIRQSRTQLTMQLTANESTQAGTHSVQVIIAGTSHRSEALPFEFAYSVPTIQSLSPNQATLGAATTEVVISGSGFAPASQVLWSGSTYNDGYYYGYSYSYVSPTQMRMTVPAAFLDESGVYPVTVVNPTPGGGSSVAANFTVNNPVPGLSLINAKTAKAGCGRFALFASGTDLVSGAEILWNGSPRPTTQVSAGLLEATIEASDIASAGNAAVSLRNPTPGGGSSSAVVFRITANGAGTTAASHDRLNASRNPVATTDCPISPPTEPVWTYNFGSAVTPIPRLPLIAEGKVMVGDGAGRYLALDAATGTRVWGPISTGLANGAAYGGGSLFVVGGNSTKTPNDRSRLAAYDTADGSQRYRVDLGPAESDHGLFGVTWANGLVYSGFDNAAYEVSLYALRPTDGSVAWKALVPLSPNAPAASSNGVYISTSASAQSSVRAFDPASGALLWQTGGESAFEPETSVAEGVVLSESSYWISRFREADGTRVGQAGDIQSNVLPTVASGIGYTLYNNAMGARRLSDNSLLWNFVPNGTLGGYPVVVNDLVLMMADSTLYALDASSGLQLWKLQIPVAYTRNFVIGDGYLALVEEQQLFVYRLGAQP